MGLLALIAVVAALYFTREVCVPVILAILLSFVLSPVVDRLQTWRVPRIVAALSVVGAMLVLLASCAWLTGGQLLSMAEMLPQYQSNVHEKFKDLQTAPGGVFDRLKNTIDSYSKEVESIGTQSQPADGAGAFSPSAPPLTVQPITVAVATARTSRLAALEGLFVGAMGPVTSFGIVMILTLLILIRREDVRDRAIRLLGGGQLQVATQALNDAGTRVSRYLLVQLIINASFGASVAVGLFLIGVPFSVLWGLLAAGLRFIPYFGAPIAAVAPLILAFAATPGWTAVLLTLVLFVVLELSIANLVEPWLYGAHAKMSPLGIIVSANNFSSSSSSFVILILLNNSEGLRLQPTSEGAKAIPAETTANCFKTVLLLTTIGMDFIRTNIKFYQLSGKPCR